jgi:CRP-like cAMP-binding protein
MTKIRPSNRLEFTWEEIEFSLSGVITDTYNADCWLFEAGDQASHLFILKEDHTGNAGIIEIFAENDHNERPAPVDRVTEGVVGHMEFVARDEFDRFPMRMASARSLTPVTILKVPYTSLLASDPDKLRVIDRRLAVNAVSRYKVLLEAANAGRLTNRVSILAATILTLAEDTGLREVRKTQQELADEVGLRREVVNGHLNEWARAGLISFGQGYLSVLDLERFRRIVDLTRLRSRKGHDRALKRINISLAHGNTFRARNLALEALRLMPESAELKHRLILAATRCGAAKEADLLITKFGFSPENKPSQIRALLLKGLKNPLQRKTPSSPFDEDELATDDDQDAHVIQAEITQRLPALFEDVLAFPAKLLKDRFWTMPAGADRTSVGINARTLYERAFAETGGAYSGINAATMARATGDKVAASSVAREVIIRTPSSSEYWACVTRAEALALCEKWNDAAAALKDAARAKSVGPGAIASTRLQLSRLASILGEQVISLLNELPQVGIAAFTGHMGLGEDFDGVSQNAELDRVVSQVSQSIKDFKVGIGYGSLARGGDLLLAEALIASSGVFHAVLPFRVEDFILSSIKPRVSKQSHNWEKRFASALSRSASLSIISSAKSSSMTKLELDHTIRICNRRSVGLALLAADDLETQAILIAIFDGRSPDSIAGTAKLVEDCRELKIDVHTIPCELRSTSVRLERKTTSIPAKRSTYTSVVFIWPAAETLQNGSARMEEQVRRTLGDRTLLMPHSSRGSSGLALVFAETADAIEAALAIAGARGELDENVKIVCDFGPVAMTGAQEANFLGRLDGAGDIVGIPQNLVIATSSFSAEARLTNGRAYEFRPVGRTSRTKDGEDSMPTPSIALYHVQRRVFF